MIPSFPPFSELKVKEALFSMHLYKSPSPDGMNPTFYQGYWHVVGKDVCLACLAILPNMMLPHGLNDIHLVLIPKKKHIETMGNLRPILLCNVLYRIVAKILETKLKKVLSKVVSKFQGAFLLGRSITDNTLLSFEILHFLNRITQGKYGYVALKVDMAKAYDRIEWCF